MSCYCMGPQNGAPLCPCQMRAVQGWQGAETWEPTPRLARPTQQPARKLLPEAPDPSEVEQLRSALADMMTGAIQLGHGDHPIVKRARATLGALEKQPPA